MGLETQAAFRDAVDAYLDHLRFERGASEHTLAAYGNDLAGAAAFFTALGLGSWEALSPESLHRYQASLAPPTSPATLRRRVSALRGLLRYLKRRGLGPAAELPSAAGARTPRRLPKALPYDRLAALLDAPDVGQPTGLRDRAFMEAVYGAGLRVSEACGLMVSGLTLDSAALRVTGKRGKTRWVPLPVETLAWLERYLAEGRPHLLRRPLDAVFLNGRGGPLSRSMAYRIMETHARAAGFTEPVGPHVLRHTYAVHLLKGGADLRAVQELLGHASIATTQVYTELDLDEVRRKYLAAHPRP